ncbi:MAG: hypothetical protein PWP09_843 [Thermotogota bacterium]|nr:hypothetical protein [Thermotogota bacterium]
MFAKPVLNYVLSTRKRSLLETYLRTVSLFWKGRKEKALEAALRGLRKSREGSYYKYLFLSQALAVSNALNDLEAVENFRSELLKNFHKISPAIRPYIMPNVINVSILKNASRPRYWSEMYGKDRTALVFMLLAIAREAVRNGDLSSAVTLYKNVYRTASAIPHPSALIASLNDMAWYLRERHAFLSKKIIDCALFQAGFYRESIQPYLLDTLFEVEKLLMTDDLIKTSRIILAYRHVLHPRYSHLVTSAQRLLPEDGKVYSNSKELSVYLKSLAPTTTEFSQKTGIARDNAARIFKLKTRIVRSETLSRIVETFSLPLKLSMPEPLLKEKARIILQKWFERSIEELSRLSFEERQRVFLTTYISQLERDYLSRKDSFRRAFNLLVDIASFRDFMSERLETKFFVIDMTKAHALIKGRKIAVEKALENIGRKKTQQFVKIYAQLKESNKRLLDRFLRNIGRYRGISFPVRLKGPEEVREFSNFLELPVQLVLAAYWCEDDGRVRRTLSGILKLFR